MASAVVKTNYALRGPAPTLEELEEQLRNLVGAYDALTAAPAKPAAHVQTGSSVAAPPLASHVPADEQCACVPLAVEQSASQCAPAKRS